MSAPACTEANPCGGQSCIVARRQHGDFVHEDFVFRRRGSSARMPSSIQRAWAVVGAPSAVAVVGAPVFSVLPEKILPTDCPYPQTTAECVAP